MKTLFVTSEAYPFAVSGGLGEFSSALPKAMRSRFVGCRVVMPLYQDIKQEYKEQMTFIANLSVPVAWRRQYCGIFELKHNGVTYYFLDNQYYFKRSGMYGFYDDAERYAFFARAVLEILPVIGFIPNVIHCNDWQTALLPLYYSLFYSKIKGYEKIKTLLTIHNIQYQGKYGYELLEDVFGIDQDQKNLLDYDGCVNILKGGIETANKVSTVSKTYAKEILDPWFSYGLDKILNERSWKISGIVNGIDTDVYNPETDSMIFENYSADDYTNKAKNKAALQEIFGLPVRADVPLICMVSRLVSHKGFDLVKFAFDQIMSNDIQFIILGSGDWEFESFFDEMSTRYPGKFVVRTGFIPELAHKIYAGGDIFLMPSKNEPCGLAQMVALRYGTIPVVRETGGLKDTITDAEDDGNGFTFKTYNSGDMCGALFRAISMYYKKNDWNALVKKALLCDNSWKNSAAQYIKLYKELIEQ